MAVTGALQSSSNKVLIVGASELGLDAMTRLRSRGRTPIGCLQLVGERTPPALQPSVIGRVAELEQWLTAEPVDEVYVAARLTAQGKAIQHTIRTCERLGIDFALPASPFRLARATPAEVHHLDDGYVHYRCTPDRPLQQKVKRLLDVVLAALALVCLSPLLFAVAIAIKLTSPGPVFFTQMRVGQRGRVFGMLKFRSMVVDAEARRAALMKLNEQTGPVFKMKNDPRITHVGRFIRKYSIDELPQLFNILKGEMSIVGPRPPIPSEVAQYQLWHRRRLSVRPGLTCFWQISGRNSIGFDEWMRLDMKYIDNWSLWLDVKLILKTVPVVVTGNGAS